MYLELHILYDFVKILSDFKKKFGSTQLDLSQGPAPTP